MKSPWQTLIGLETLDNHWDSSPATAGVYVVMSDRPIQRIGRIDNEGILYIGKAKKLRDRLWDFWKQNHSASAFLWTHTGVAQIVLNKPILTVSEVGTHLGKLNVRYSTPISEDQLDIAERALLFAYVQYFGEAPPLNLSLPKRWDQPPPSQDRAWAEKGLFDLPQSQ
jgi:excinuclease UvrABC nuclease subunit